MGLGAGSGRGAGRDRRGGCAGRGHHRGGCPGSRHPGRDHPQGGCPGSRGWAGVVVLPGGPGRRVRFFWPGPAGRPRLLTSDEAMGRGPRPPGPRRSLLMDDRSILPSTVRPFSVSDLATMVLVSSGVPPSAGAAGAAAGACGSRSAGAAAGAAGAGGGYRGSRCRGSYRGSGSLRLLPLARQPGRRQPELLLPGREPPGASALGARSVAGNRVPEWPERLALALAWRSGRHHTAIAVQLNFTQHFQARCAGRTGAARPGAGAAATGAGAGATGSSGQPLLEPAATGAAHRRRQA